MSMVTKVAKARLIFHANMLDVGNVLNQLGILDDKKANEFNKKHCMACFDAMEHMGLDPYGYISKEEERPE